MKKGTLLCATLVAVLSPQWALADDFHQQKLAQWGDPFTLPQTRTRCIHEAKGDWPWGGGWSTCTEWAVDNRTMQCSVYLRVPDVASIPSA
ncbi:MAG: hypothetical protein RLZZ342_315, partial [Candidatus Parcubacteria bacterium]